MCRRAARLKRERTQPDITHCVLRLTRISGLLSELDTLGLTEDTIVVFTSSHGWTLGSHGLDEINQPLEEASRIPLLIRFPRRIKRRGQQDALISNVDYAPTLLSLCGVEPLAGMQGVDFSKWLTGHRRAPRSSIYAEGDLGSAAEWRMAVHYAYKLVVDYTLRPTHLYHLGEDPYELHNLATVSASGRNRDHMPRAFATMDVADLRPHSIQLRPLNDIGPWCFWPIPARRRFEALSTS